jgi:CubicO group peptidase (beta-lactamase class C family)
LTFVTALSACGGGGDTPTSFNASPAVATQQAADKLISAGVPGAAVVHLTAQDTHQASAGVRVINGNSKVLPDDVFMLGSTTKALTSALAGRLVERGLIAWDTTLSQALPQLSMGMLPEYRQVTLEQLLGHRGGVSAFNTEADFARFVGFLGSSSAAASAADLPARQEVFAAWLLAQTPPAGVAPGRDFFYSNAGYALAAMMLEARSGKTYQALMEEELARPLGLTLSWTAADRTRVGQPAGHEGSKGKLVVAQPATAEEAVWLDVLQPAGEGLSMPATSYANWLRAHLKALQGVSTPLAAGYVQRIKGLRGDTYAFGWYAAQLDGRPLLSHDGQIRGFTSLVALDIAGRSGSFVMANAESTDAESWVMSTVNQTLVDLERSVPPR